MYTVLISSESLVLLIFTGKDQVSDIDQMHKPGFFRVCFAVKWLLEDGEVVWVRDCIYWRADAHTRVAITGARLSRCKVSWGRGPGSCPGRLPSLEKRVCAAVEFCAAPRAVAEARTPLRGSESGWWPLRCRKAPRLLMPLIPLTLQSSGMATRFLTDQW